MIKNAFYELRSFDQSSVSGEKREAESAIIAFYNCLKEQVQKQINETEQNMRYADRFFFDNNGSAIELLTEMNAAIHNLSSSIQIYSSMDFRNKMCIRDRHWIHRNTDLHKRPQYTRGLR